MEFESDAAKRLANIDKHGLDFRDAPLPFEDAHLVAPARSSGDESRWLLIGRLEGLHGGIVFTRRGGAIRVTLMRKARDDERRRHQAIFG
jgi:uncharacterized DUF497 family protein